MRMLCLDFFESDWRDFRGRWLREYLREPEWIGQFLDRWNLHVATAVNYPGVSGQSLKGVRMP